MQLFQTINNFATTHGLVLIIYTGIFFISIILMLSALKSISIAVTATHFMTLFLAIVLYLGLTYNLIRAHEGTLIAIIMAGLFYTGAVHVKELIVEYTVEKMQKRLNHINRVLKLKMDYLEGLIKIFEMPVSFTL